MKIHWMPLTLDEQYLDTVLEKAHAYGADTIQFSHTLIHNADDVLNDRTRLERMQNILKKTKAAGYEAWCWTHEILNPPAECLTDGKLDIDSPVLEEHLRRKYADFLTDKLPGLDGLVLTFAETQYEVYKPAKVFCPYEGKEASVYKTRKLIDLMFDALQKHGTKLAIRDFVYRKNEIHDMLDVIRKLDDRVSVMSKCVPHDWDPYYPDNEVVGQVAPKDQWVEFDLGHEYEMQGIVPYAEPRELLARMRRFAAIGIGTVCLRLDRYDGDTGASAVCTPWGQLELSVFSGFAKNPDVSAEEIIEQWERGQFAGAAEIAELSTQIVKRMLFPNRLWTGNHSNLPDFEYCRTHLKDGNADRLPVWTGLSEDLENTERSDRPDPEFYAELLKTAEACRADYRKIRTILSENNISIADFPLWEKGLNLLERWMELFLDYQAAYFAIRLYQAHPEAMAKNAIEGKIAVLEHECSKYAAAYPVVKLTHKLPWQTHAHVVESLRDQIS